MTRSLADIPLSLAHLSELDVPPAELAEFAARAGFASIGLRTHPASPGGVAYALRGAGEVAALRRRLAASGIAVLYVEMISIDERMRAADHRAMLEIGAELGASRLAVAGDSADFAVVAEKLAEICDLARGFGIAVDLEFMPFRAVATLADALEVVRRAGRPNAHVLIDALHVFRSGSPPALLASSDRAVLGTFQLCDAPAVAPPHAELAVEARTRRLLPGRGGLDLRALIAALPAEIPFGVEVPLALQHPALDPAARLALLARETRNFLNERNA